MTKLLPCGRPVPVGPDSGGVARVGKSAQKAEQHRTAYLEKLDAYLAAHNLKHSDQRVKIVELMLQQPGHFTVQELLKKLRAKHPEIGAATVYRTAKLLVDAAILSETLVADSGESVYEVFSGDHHDHIVCLDCRHIFEFHDESIEEAQSAVAEKMHFSEVSHRHVIYARCSYGDGAANKKRTATRNR